MKKTKPKYKGKLLLVDGNNWLCRGHYATPTLTTKDGTKTNGIKGFFNILLADINTIEPTHVVVAFDSKGGSKWRRELYPDYKGNRIPKDKKGSQDIIDIAAQGKPLRSLLKSIGIRTSKATGQEADDLIGTIAVDFAAAGFHVIIGSKDKDFAQLVNVNINMLIPATRTLLDPEGIKEKFGVWPEQIIDYLALLGDKADNIPGVEKCGPVTAAKLLVQHETLEGIRKNKDSMTPALRKNFELVEHRFTLNKKLLKIKTDLNLLTTIESAEMPKETVNTEKFNSLCHHLNLKQTQTQIIRTLQRI